MSKQTTKERQRAFLHDLMQAGKGSSEIYRTMKDAYKETCMSKYSMHRWIRRFELGENSVKDRPGKGRKKTATTSTSIHNVAQWIEENKRITVSFLASFRNNFLILA